MHMMLDVYVRRHVLCTHSTIQNPYFSTISRRRDARCCVCIKYLIRRNGGKYVCLRMRVYTYMFGYTLLLHIWAARVYVLMH